MKNKMNNSKNLVVLLVIVNFLILGFYYTYAFFITKQIQENVAVLNTNNNGISMSLNDKILVSSKEEKEVVITITNNNMSKLYYKLLQRGAITGVAVYFNKSHSNFLLSKESEKLTVRIINNTDIDVNIEFYLQSSFDENFDKDFSYDYVNEKLNYDHSGANPPNTKDLGLYFPVYYEKITDTDGVWKIADKNNTDNNNIWYDYGNQRWANIVFIHETSRDNYINAKIGSVINDEDILAFFVWIPSFKYKVINNSNINNYEKDVNVIFTNKNDSGTVTCKDQISSNTDLHIYSEICKDTVYGNIYDNLSTYFHPAFKFNNNSISGFWVSKFQVSDNGTRAVPNATSTLVNMSSAFNFSRGFELIGNLYGINGNGYKIMNDGNILLDNNEIDSHTLTNMEWGALSILSNSLYGKSGNNEYFTDEVNVYKRIYVNNFNYDNRTGCSSNYNKNTNSFINNASSVCIPYNDLTSATHISNSIIYPIGPIGPGASTTGTIYGVYDMAGGNKEMVMGLISNRDGSVLTTIDKKYYNKYSYNDYIGIVDSSYTANNIYRYKLGDGIREHYRNFNTNGMWYSGILNQSNDLGYMVRGGSYNGNDASIYSVSISSYNDSNAFRVSISALS